MTTTAAAAQGKWWVVAHPTGARGGPPSYITVQATTSPPGEVAGPFPTQAAAEQWIQGTITQGGLPPAPSIPNPFGFLAALGWIQEIGHWVGIAVSAITDIHMWISLGWITLGFWAMVIGILLWLRIPQRAARAAKTAAEGAAAAAVVA